MKLRFPILLSTVFSIASFLSVTAQDAPPAHRSAQGFGGGQGQRGGWGSGVMGTVTAVSADHLTIKSEDGQTFTVQFSVNTHFLHQTAVGRGAQGGEGRRMGPGGTPPQPIKSSDIKVGDAISAMGEPDSAAKSIGAVYILQLDPEAARQMREMRANFGKTWLMGKVTAIKDVSVTIDCQVDHAAHTFTADENTTFREHRDPITLGDLQVGDMVRVEGSVKNGGFVAATVSVMRMPQGGTPMVPRSGSPTNPPQ